MLEQRSNVSAARPNRRAIFEWTLEQLYDLVFSGEISAGATIREEQLTARFGVSRSPVRESLRQLELDGLLDVDRETGRRRLARFGPDDIYELYTIRAGLEEVAASHAAHRATPEVLTQLKELQTTMDKAIADAIPIHRDFTVDIAFHKCLCEASGLRRLGAALLPIWGQTRALLYHLHATGRYNDRAEDELAYADHRAIIVALERKDPRVAASAVRRHLHERRDQLIRMFNESTDELGAQTTHIAR